MKIGIIGAGASGMMAAITAARCGAHVTLFEKNSENGKKILATGNGKCNLSNKKISSTDYFSQSSDCIMDYISRFTEQDTISFFLELGMLLIDKEDLIYPYSEQARSVVQVLQLEIKKRKIRQINNSSIKEMRKENNKFLVIYEDEKKFTFDKLIIATGTYAGMKRDTKKTGYDFAYHFGHTIIPVVPALVQLKVVDSKNIFKEIAGVRVKANISLYINNLYHCTEYGELQITEYGVSGIPIFQLSGVAARSLLKNSKVKTYIDLFPDISDNQLKEMISKKLNQYSNFPLKDIVFGLANEKLLLFFMKHSCVDIEKKVSELKSDDIYRIFLQMKQWNVMINKPNKFESAQVCSGGVSLEEVDENLQSKFVPGLYFAGEILDVDGRCGGYNLQWAWTSGAIVGNAVSEEKE